MWKQKKCRWCDKAAVFLCDFVAGPAEERSCDAPMCADHRTCVMSGMLDCSHPSGRRGGPGTGPFSIDHCPDHANRKGVP
jgi:hypothetical protein